MNASPRSVAMLLGFGLGLATTSPAIAATQTGDQLAVASASQQMQSVALTPFQVRSVQRRLHLSVDGVLDHGVRHAINSYQHHNALAETAHPNVQTLRELHLGLADQLQNAVVAGTDGDQGSAARQALHAALSQQGTPYAWGGTSPGGFDCSGLTMWAFAKTGISLPRTSQAQYASGAAVAKSDVRAGDLVFFSTAGSGASHVGIALSSNTAVSATSSGGVMKHSISDGYWAEYYIGARHITA